jgi:hypothetical protein
VNFTTESVTVVKAFFAWSAAEPELSGETVFQGSYREISPPEFTHLSGSTCFHYLTFWYCAGQGPFLPEQKKKYAIFFGWLRSSNGPRGGAGQCFWRSFPVP